MPIGGYFITTFGQDGDRAAVPDTTQVDGSVSYDQGYGPDYELDPLSNPDAIDIERTKFNQLMFDVTTALQKWQQQSVADFITPTMNGGTPYSYPAYVLVMYDPGTGKQIYQSLIPGNTDLPTVQSSWAAVPLGLQSFTTGDLKPTMKNVADAGWVLCNDGTIGNATSGGTARANADTAALFSLLWTNVSNTYAPVSGGRGGSAAADFAANKTIGLTLMLGRALGVAGAGAGLSARVLGQALGDENLQQHNHTINDPTHIHQMNAYTGVTANGTTDYVGDSNSTSEINRPTQSAATGISINNTGSGGAGNMQPTSFVNIMIKL